MYLKTVQVDHVAIFFLQKPRPRCIITLNMRSFNFKTLPGKANKWSNNLQIKSGTFCLSVGIISIEVAVAFETEEILSLA